MASEEEDNAQNVSLYFIFFSGLFALVIILSKLLHEQPRLNSFLSEAALILILAIITGAMVDIVFVQDAIAADDDTQYEVAQSLLSFDSNVFFLGLLPPILFNSGYQLRRELFYRHLKPIVMFSVLGTLTSAVCTAFFLYLVSWTRLMGAFEPTLLELLVFGSLIAATDTVSVLAVFQKKKVDPHLFYVVFGESALNDAVALVLFKSFSDFIIYDYDTAGSILRQSGLFFIGMFAEAIGSPMLGMSLGIGAALIFNHFDLRQHPMLELPLYILLMYIPFLLAECMKLSGIVTIFFTGMAARRYIAPNVSKETERNAEVIFKLAAYVAETCIFLELGLSVVGLGTKFMWSFIGWAFLAALLGRACAIYPLAYYYNRSLRELPKDEDVNYIADDGAVSSCSKSVGPGVKKRTPVKRKDKKISVNMAHILWFAGLRGAVAYACAREFPDTFQHRDEFTAATMFIVLVTIIGMGGATEHLLRYLNIEMDIDEDQHMEKWHKEHDLRGKMHRFEQEFVYETVVRDAGRDPALGPTSKESFDTEMADFDYRQAHQALSRPVDPYSSATIQQ